MDEGAAGSHDPAGSAEPSEEQLARRRRHLHWFAPPLVVLVVLGYVGDAFLPRLVDSNPTALVLLNPRNRNLALVANQLDALTFYAAASFRLLLTDPIWFFIGREYGDAALDWVARRSKRYGELARNAESWFGKAAYPIVFLAPNYWVCLLAGAARMRPAAFLVLNVSGTFARLYSIRIFGDVFSGPLDDLTGWIGEHQWQLIAITLPLAAFFLWRDFRGGGELDSLTHLEEEMEEEADEEP